MAEAAEIRRKEKVRKQLNVLVKRRLAILLNP
jgi:hypothetical protein